MIEGILSAMLQIIGTVLFKWYGWVLVVAILGYLIWQNRRREQWINQTEHILLLIEIPKDNEKKELSAEQMFASLHGILRPKSELRREGSMQEHISFELASRGNKIQFYVWTPRHLKDFVEGQIYAQYPNVRIREGVEDYAVIDINERYGATTELVLTKDEVLPLKTFQSFEVDPLAGITAVLAKLDQPGEEMWIQVLARPEDDSWQDKGLQYIEEVKSGKMPAFRKRLTGELLQLPIYLVAHFFSALFSPPEAAKENKKDDKLSTGQQAITKAIEAKITKLGYQVKIRIGYLGPEEQLGKQRMQAIVGAFKQFNTTNLNGFTTSRYRTDDDGVREYRARLFFDEGYTLNIEELASIYHLPHKSVETPNMVWATSKTSEPPSDLPTPDNTESGEVSLFGLTNYRGDQAKFGIKRRDRGRHLYVIGQTGTGKSFLLNLLTLSDIYHNQGFAVVDPHGDFATDTLKFIPEHRINDVIYFNPTDRDFPIAFNPLEVSDPAFKNHISSEMVGVLKRMFDSWGPRLEYILRYTILALLDYPDSTMLGITRMLTEKEFRKKVIKEIKDPVVRNFWVNEFASWNDKFANEAVAPVLNKVGAFTANPLVRNIIGQPSSAMDLRAIMDEGKILVVNLSHGQIGEDNAAILGALIVTKIQLAAMGRANIALEQRRPFYLYVDEFQNFATDSFAVILSEARKYGLNLTVANQYVSQMPEEVRDAVFGNVGSMISFRCGANDSAILGKYFEPSFEPSDLVKLNNQHIFISMSINGEKSLPFSATTLMMPKPDHDYTAEITKLSRQKYASSRQSVEEQITAWNEGRLDAKDPENPSMSVPSEQKPNGILGGLKNPDRLQMAKPDNRATHNTHNDRDRRDHRNSRSASSGRNRQGHGSRDHRNPAKTPLQDEHKQSAGGNRDYVVTSSHEAKGMEADREVSLRK